jgi:ADP-ribose pyrophosphatase
MFHFYYARVSNPDKASKGGGLAAENEQIDVVEMPVDEFVNHVERCAFEDSKTCIAGLYFSNYIWQKTGRLS